MHHIMDMCTLDKPKTNQFEEDIFKRYHHSHIVAKLGIWTLNMTMNKDEHEYVLHDSFY